MAGIERYLRAPLQCGLLPLPIQVGANSVGSEVTPDAAIRIDVWHLRQQCLLSCTPLHCHRSLVVVIIREKHCTVSSTQQLHIAALLASHSVAQNADVAHGLLTPSGWHGALLCKYDLHLLRANTRNWPANRSSPAVQTCP